MLDFVWHLRGSVALDTTASNAVVLDRVEHLLVRQRKPVSERGPDHLAFDDPLWRDPLGPNWLAMLIYDRGRFWIEAGSNGRRLRYDLRSLHAIVFCLIGSFTVSLVGLAGSELCEVLKLAAWAFGWLYGMNIVLAVLRVPTGIRKAVTSD